LAKDLKKLLKKISVKDKKPLSPPKKKYYMSETIKVMKLYKMGTCPQKAIVKDPRKKLKKRDTRNTSKIKDL
jgi:hypothetical protein